MITIGRTARSFAIILALFSLFSGTAQASTIQFWTGDTQDSVTPGEVTAITPHSVWGDVSNHAGLLAGKAKWISYANTGVGGDTVAPGIKDPDNNGNNDDRTIGNETALFSRTLLIGGAGDFDFWLLADDTATAVLNGPGNYSNTLFTASTQQIDPRAPGYGGTGLGCVENAMGHISLSGLASGLYTLNVTPSRPTATSSASSTRGATRRRRRTPTCSPRRSRCLWSCSGPAWSAWPLASGAAGSSPSRRACRTRTFGGEPKASDE